MREILIGECYRAKRNKYYITVCVIILILLLAYSLFLGLYKKIDSFEIFFCNLLCMADIFLPIMTIFCMNLLEEYREKTLKNACVICDRKSVYDGKLLFQFVISFGLYSSGIIVGFIGSYVMTDGNTCVFSLQKYLALFLFGMLLIIRNLVTADFLIVLIKNEIIVVIIYIVGTGYAGEIIKYMIPKLYDCIGTWLLSSQIIYFKMFNFSCLEYALNVCICLTAIVFYFFAGRVIFEKVSVK